MYIRGTTKTQNSATTPRATINTYSYNTCRSCGNTYRNHPYDMPQTTLRVVRGNNQVVGDLYSYEVSQRTSLRAMTQGSALLEANFGTRHKGKPSSVRIRVRGTVVVPCCERGLRPTPCSVVPVRRKCVSPYRILLYKQYE